MREAPVFEGLEVRAEEDGSRTIAGRFPYGVTATISDGGRRGKPKKERFASHAFEYRVNNPDEDVHLLLGHDFDKPIASKLSDTMSLEDSAEALTFEATIPPAMQETQHVRDALAMISSGLAVGLSPGFRIPPERAVEDAEEISQEENKPEEGKNEAQIRTVKAALLFELSIVTKPAFEEASVEARRRWSGESRPLPAAWRWR